VIVEDFKKILRELESGPIPGKHVYIWNGDRDSLLRIMERSLAEELDLSSAINVDVDENQSNGLAFSRAIEKALEKKLYELYSEATQRGKQQMLIVTSPSILARYQIGLTAFYNYYIGDRTKVILVVPKSQALVGLGLPDYVRYQPEETMKYLSNVAQPENIVE
jgi:hypothetical protein